MSALQRSPNLHSRSTAHRRPAMPSLQETGTEGVSEGGEMSRVKPPCQWCGQPSKQKWSAINRALRDGKPIYCGRECAGLARRKGKTPEQKKEEKRLYDLNYRSTSPTLKARKAAYYQRTHDPVKEAVERKKRAPQHAEYCRRPEYKAWKKEYDQKYLAQKHYGDFGDVSAVLLALEREIRSQVDRQEIYAANGTINKKLQRRRKYEQQKSGNL